mmetsp:Transcript_4814/g.6633  ORF Transcript_4814/g.6633 Transcript_4814/m.6633 type:complete len:414 (+) Transcript_4814:140-1381(+)
MILDKCTDACGYFAAVAAAICLGSFGVPAKSKVVTRLDADPMVIQTYKSTWAFLTCWLVVLSGEPIKFTSWGVVSGIFWVPGGIAGIYAIRNAGLAIAVGTWSSIIVLTSFFWGIGVFEEHVRSELGACGACLTLVVGLVGMSRYSKPPNRIKEVDGEKKDGALYEEITRVPSGNDLDVDISKRTVSRKASRGKSDAANTGNNETKPPSPSRAYLEIEAEPLLQDDSTDEDVEAQEKKQKSISIMGQFTVTKREMGIIAAVFNGLWGGTNLVPLHYASHEGFGGPMYVISFACGSMLVTIALWVIRFLFELYRLDGAVLKAFHALPPLHIRQMWIPGTLSGILWSAGNFMCIISVTFLGQGVGYSFTQASMLISGLWGIFYFHEIGEDMINRWLASAVVALCGILWLSYEHSK